MTQKEKVDSLNARTRFQKTVKEVLLEMIDGTPDSVDINTDNLESNRKSDLVTYADFHDLEVEEPKNKPEYVEAIQKHLNR